MSMLLGMPTGRYLFVVGLLALTSACGSQTRHAPQLSGQPTLASAPTTEANVAEAAWLSVVRNADPVLAAQLPSEVAIGPSWHFAETVQGEAEPSSFHALCGRQMPEQPAWLLVRFLVDSEPAGEPYREGTLDIRLYRGVQAVLDDYMAYEETANCLEDALPAGATLTNISGALPTGTVKAFRIDLGHTSGEPEAEFTVVYAHRQGVAFQVLVSAIQPVGHPNALDTTEEALRVTGEIMAAFD